MGISQNPLPAGILHGTKILTSQGMVVAEKLTFETAITGYDSKNNTFPSVKIEQLTVGSTCAALIITTDKGVIRCDSQQHFDVVFEFLRAVANNEKSLCVYAFVWYLMEGCETANLHILAAEIARKIFDHRPCYLPEGIEQTAFFHIHRASELAPDDIRLQEKFLEFYETTPQSFEESEAQKIAENVLKRNPGS